MPEILIVEDEARISAFMSKGLAAEGFTSYIVTTGFEGLQQALTGSYRLVILDLGLPDMDGFDVLKKLRAQDTELPVIILTARTSGADTVAGLTSGANDYVPKPFRFPELVARVKLRLQDAERGQSTESEDATDPDTRHPEDEPIIHADLELDPLQHLVTVAGETVELSAREFDLAETFLRHPGQALSRDQLVSLVWGDDFDSSSNIVDVYVRYLRNKLGAKRFVTVRGIGYRLAREKDYHQHYGTA